MFLFHLFFAKGRDFFRIYISRRALCLVLIGLIGPGISANNSHALNAKGSRPFQPTITGPAADLLQLDVPSELGNQEYAALGLVDVTASPFGADPSGKGDSTEAIRKAVLFARDHQMVCFFPSGTYLISDTIECPQLPYLRTSGVLSNGANYPCILLGSRKDKRPVLRLASGSAGFDNPSKPKYVIHFWAEDKQAGKKEQPNISMNQQFINIDLQIDPGNQGAVGIRHRGAQGCSIQESVIDVADGYAGIEGGCGSGGSFSNLVIRGGQIGLDLRQTQPAPTIAGVILKQQKSIAILYGGRQSLSAVGIKIFSDGAAPAVKAVKSLRNPARGHISLVDAEIAFTQSSDEAAIMGQRNIYLNNVFINGARFAIQNSRNEKLASPSASVRIAEYAHGAKPSWLKGFRYSYPVYIEGNKNNNDLAVLEDRPSPPPADLVSRHQPNSMPNWEQEGVNVKHPPFNAKGDGRSDDSDAIQQAINAHRTVFLPKGVYRITRTLHLKKDTRLVGVGNTFSILMATGNFADTGSPQSLVQTADSAGAATQISSLGLFAPKEAENVFLLDWQSGADSFLINVNFLSQPPLKGFSHPLAEKAKPFPLVKVSGHGGGRWWNFFQEDHLGQGSSYSHLAIQGITGPFTIYQCNPEHSRGRANLEISDAQNIRIFGLKSEGNHPVLLAQNANNLSIFGYGGNASALPETSLFILDKAFGTRIVNAVDAPRFNGEGGAHHYAGRGVDPDQWTMITEKKAGLAKSIQALERPVLYKTASTL